MINSSEQKIKRPFWKKWWVWVIAVFVIITVLTIAAGGRETYEIIAEKEGRFDWEAPHNEVQPYYEVVCVTGAKKEAKVIAVARKLKNDFRTTYLTYGNIAIYLFDAKYKSDAKSYLRLPVQKRRERENYYNKRQRATLWRSKQEFPELSYLFFYDKDGNIIKSITDF